MHDKAAALSTTRIVSSFSSRVWFNVMAWGFLCEAREHLRVCDRVCNTGSYRGRNCFTCASGPVGAECCSATDMLSSWMLPAFQCRFAIIRDASHYYALTLRTPVNAPHLVEACRLRMAWYVSQPFWIAIERYIPESRTGMHKSYSYKLRLSQCVWGFFVLVFPHNSWKN